MSVFDVLKRKSPVEKATKELLEPYAQSDVRLLAMDKLIEIIAANFIGLSKTTNETTTIGVDLKQVKICQWLDHLHHIAELMVKLLQHGFKQRFFTRNDLDLTLQSNSLSSKSIRRFCFDQYQTYCGVIS